MPFEVSEIAISMRVTSDADVGDAAGDRPGPLDDEARKTLIDECVERVLQVLRAERER
jgi:hypothetical protein